MRTGTIAITLLALVALLPVSAGSVDDTVLFSTNVTPNVLLVLDNSGSMANIVWHEDFDPNAATTCNVFADSVTYVVSSDVTVSFCGRTRTVFHDNQVNPYRTRYLGKYLNWLFSPEADAAYTEIQGNGNGFPSSCVGGAPFAKYQRARITAAKQAIKDIVCEVNLVTQVRFGFAVFRAANDPNGGYVRVPVDDYNSQQAADLDSALQPINAETWTPLGETLFQTYTYFMSRTASDRPFGKDGVTRFPEYVYKTSTSQGGGPASNSGPPQVPDSPVQWSCQKNFVVIITDGEPTMDDFRRPVQSTSEGFDDFEAKLIGNYNPDDALPEAGNEEPGTSPTCTNCQVAYYLDDIAKFMQDVDFRPDMAGDQTIDVYTVGFTTATTANQLLAKTAQVGNGEFYFSNTSDELVQAIVDAFTDIVQKSQSFTAATVPASRTIEGGNIYISFFIPATDPGIWEGHLKNFEFTGSGEILDNAGNCVVDTPETSVNPPPCDTTGTVRTNADGYWDAAQQMPSASARTLYASRPSVGPPDCGTSQGSDCVVFDQAQIAAVDLGVTAGEIPLYAGSLAVDAEGLADEIVDYLRGCEFASSPCVDRLNRLGDIFHSNPLLVGPPNAPINESSYIQFAIDHEHRSRVIYVGANDAFLHGFDAGAWNPSGAPPGYGDGTGSEVFGFMPWPARQNAKQLPIDGPPRDYYYVDGSPQAADVWFPEVSPLQVTKVKTEWRTVLLGGLRQGGRAYYALDVTDPPGNPDLVGGYAAYPTYLWEFPCETATCDAWRPYMGETWAEPVVTRVRVAIDGDDNAGQGYERWVAVLTAGYDPAGDPNDQAAYDGSSTASTSRAGRAILIVDIASGKLLAMKKFEHNATSPEDEMRFAIASTPAVFDLDFDGFADVIYVGDLGGNLWKWVVREVGSFVSSPGDVYDPLLHAQPSWTFKKFFSAPVYTKAGVSYYKSIFFPPTGTLKSGKLYLGFGTGERQFLGFEGFTNTEDENNRFYVMIDLDRYETAGLNPSPIDESPGVLLDITDGTSDCNAISGYQGYFIRGRDSEKFISNSIIFFGEIWTGSFIPLNDADPCTAGGDAYVYRFDLVCGTGGFPDEGPLAEDERRIQLGTGIPTAPRVSVGPTPDPNDPTPECQTRVYVISSDGGLTNQCAGTAPPSSVKVFNWRER